MKIIEALPSWLRIILLVGCLVHGSAVARADEPLDWVMTRSPELPPPRVVLTFWDKLPALWLEALRRPEVEYRCQAALTIARARERGMDGLQATVSALIAELDRADPHPASRLAAARALVALDAKDAAPAFFKLSGTSDNDLREVIEPALARWDHAPARGAWLARIAGPSGDRRGAVLAIQALAAVKEDKAVPRLRELVLSAETNPAVRLEAARALGVLRTSGGEADADTLTADSTPKGLIARLAAAWVLRHHSGDGAVRRLRSFVRDTEPSVAAVAVARLVEIEPALVEPVLPDVLGSPDANVRGFGVEVLARRPSEQHTQLLGDRLSDPHPDVRARARNALRERAKAAEFQQTVLAVGTRVLAANDWRGKEQAAFLLALLDHKPASGRLVELLTDRRPEVAVAAAWALRVLAVPETYPKSLEHFRQSTRKGPPPEWLDKQLCQIAQMLGTARYAPADATFRGMISPKAAAGPETRAAACWALGFIHEGDPVPAIASGLTGRLAAVNPFDMEHHLVRHMCAVTLGRMKAKGSLETLRQFYVSKKPSFDPVNNACGWAIEQITGEKMPPPGVVEAPQIDWFLLPRE